MILDETTRSTKTEVTNLPLTHYNKIRSSRKQNIISINPAYGKNFLRDDYTETGTGTVSNNIENDGSLH